MRVSDEVTSLINVLTQSIYYILITGYGTSGLLVRRDLEDDANRGMITQRVEEVETLTFVEHDELQGEADVATF